MTLLCVETSSKYLSLAVAEGEKVLRYRNKVLGHGLSSGIVPAIEAILRLAKRNLDQMDAFAVGLGPGGFTSLRVGLSTVKGLSLATGKPVMGVGSLELVAANAPSFGDVCVLVDARRRMVYAAVYQMEGGRPRQKKPPHLTTVTEALKELRPGTIITGDGLAVRQDEIQEEIQRKGLVALAERDWFPQARRMPALLAKRWQQECFDDAANLAPMYLYPDTCQVRPATRNCR